LLFSESWNNPTKFPISLGTLLSWLWWRWRVVRVVRLPISLGSLEILLWWRCRVWSEVRFPI